MPPTCLRCTRPATMHVRSLGGSDTPTCTRCAGSVIRTVANDTGAIVDLAGVPGPANREHRAKALATTAR